MKISLNLIKEFVNIPEKFTADELAKLLTIHTAEVEHVEDQSESFNKIVVGQIKKIKPHPNADKLKITETDVGSEVLQIVCGAPNIKEGMFVAVALIGAKVRWHGEGDLIALEKAQIRGVESSGMICGGEEIGLEKTPEGVLDLTPLKPKVGQSLAEVLGKDDTVLLIDNKSLTHRPDLWGHYGIAREIAAITGSKLKPLSTKVTYPKKGSELKIEVKEKTLCPRYLGTIIENIKIEESPLWLKNKLNAIGYRPVNNIVDATNYVMAELGQPLHAFDATQISKGIIVRTANQGEQMETIDHKKYKLSPEMLLIADHEKPLAVAGVMGGLHSEINPSTTKIIIESANFNGSSVRKTSVKLGLRTEAVQRFEKSLDPNLAEESMDRICELILKLCPNAKISSPKVDIKNFKDQKISVNLDLKKVCSKIGKEIKLTEIIKILESLQFKITKKTTSKLQVEIPSFRVAKDINMEDDLVEEVARMHGYNNIEAKLPELPIKLPLENKERKQKHFARQILSLGLGFDEVSNYSFYSLNDFKKSLLPEEPHIKIQNPLSEEQRHLRLSLITNLLKNVAHNLKSFDEFKIYEIGRTYENLQEYFPIEEKKICAVIVRKSTSTQTFYEAKGALETFLEMFKTPGIEMKKGESFCPYAHPNKYIEYYSKASDEAIAKAYELHPIIAKNFEVEKSSIAAFEINFTRLVQLGQKNTKYKPIPKFPGIEFDVSVLIDKKTEIGNLQKTIKKVDPNLIKEIKLFDFYEGSNIPENKKALAFKIYLEREDRTMEDSEMKNVQQKIFNELIKLGGEIRGLK